MELFKHYRNGTTHIDSDGEYHGYLPSRQDKLLALNITHNDYVINVYEDALVIKYKYMTMTYEHSFTVGRWRYNLAVLQTYPHNEKKQLVYMDSLLRTLISDHTIEGCHVSDYTAIQLINSHRVNDTPQGR